MQNLSQQIERTQARIDALQEDHGSNLESETELNGLKQLQKNYKSDLEKMKSKETYGQTRGLSNLEMKHVGKLAIIGALSKTKLCSYHARSHLSYKAYGF